MADSDAVRSRRRRAHAAGDHSLCRPGCGGTKPAVVLPMISAVRDEIPEPGAKMWALALRLEAAHEADPANALLARELRATLLHLDGGRPGAAGPDIVDRLRWEWEHGSD
jgi:hypothetical protein